MLLIICVEPPRPEALPDACPGFFGDATSPSPFTLVSVVDSQAVHTPVCYECVFVPERPFNSSQHQFVYLRDLTAERHAPHPAHPTPEAANELLLYTLMKYNCIMVCK